MQISCVGVRSYGLVCPPANLPPCLERLSLATKAWGRRVGPSLLLFSPKDLPNLKVWWNPAAPPAAMRPCSVHGMGRCLERGC